MLFLGLFRAFFRVAYNWFKSFFEKFSKKCVKRESLIRLIGEISKITLRKVA